MTWWHQGRLFEHFDTAALEKDYEEVGMDSMDAEEDDEDEEY